MSYSITDDFKNFVNELKPSSDSENTKSNRYHSILRRINYDYWNINDENSHGLYVGSHGRGTDIYTSDIDIVVMLPWSTYSRINDYSGNKQSSLLQEVKNVLKKTYSSSELKGDGQVIVISFSDGMRFEIVPAFEMSDGSFCYADSNDGGKWKYMDPRSEIKKFNEMNKECNYNLKNICKMMREWNKKNTVLLSGIVIDCMVYDFLLNYEYKDKGYVYYDWFSRDFFKYLKDTKKKSWNVPCGGWEVKPKYSFDSEASKSYDDCVDAIDLAQKDYEYSCKSKWRDVYGSKFK